jgi:hypothetical protein
VFTTPTETVMTPTTTLETAENMKITTETVMTPTTTLETAENMKITTPTLVGTPIYTPVVTMIDTGYLLHHHQHHSHYNYNYHHHTSTYNHLLTTIITIRFV